ncbi:DUF92 domain-containing protein [Paenibacillus sp. J2TS4]|uniref:DUF92 domain-containing protein n=1 Tax=Paenibacillus sp. J2TS4 TaxID=2807194 RepID=UPI001B08EA80|nr:DUF92 domain-containing protein [Paenibacillus sp. J2TS4]GIP32202.1 hypothetical protein J2TS4_14120 [Paenibacillus sp. J2TS4]
MGEWWIGLAGSLVIAGAAYWKSSLSRSGLVAAVVLGTAMYAAGSLPWYGTLIAFFVTSTLLSKWKSRSKAKAESGYAKSGRRDAGQVLANGGLGLLLCLGHALWPNPGWWAAFIGVMATVTADTWATEIGGWSRSQPRSIVTGRKVAAGTSGGITKLGIAASAAGGLVIGATAWLLSLLQQDALDSSLGIAAGPWPLLALGIIGGLAGSLIDSWLGAVVQVMYRCRICGAEVEKTSHCETSTDRIRGLGWMTNDAVNALSSAAGGLVSLLLTLVIP